MRSRIVRNAASLSRDLTETSKFARRGRFIAIPFPVRL
jgi:hypothetical protein